MGKKLTITLDRLDLGQLLDGLRMRAESYENTATFIESGYVADDSFSCEECRDADEATRLAKHYRSIIESIERQVSQQGGW